MCKFDSNLNVFVRTFFRVFLVLVKDMRSLNILINKIYSSFANLDLNSSGNRKSMNTDGYHIAFGTKISGQRKTPKEVTRLDFWCG